MLESSHTLKIGEHLYSVRVGKRETFVGEVVFINADGRYVHLCDDQGREWHRTTLELSKSLLRLTLRNG